MTTHNGPKPWNEPLPFTSLRFLSAWLSHPVGTVPRHYLLSIHQRQFTAQPNSSLLKDCCTMGQSVRSCFWDKSLDTLPKSSSDSRLEVFYMMPIEFSKRNRTTKSHRSEHYSWRHMVKDLEIQKQYCRVNSHSGTVCSGVCIYVYGPKIWDKFNKKKQQKNNNNRGATQKARVLFSQFK